VKHLLVDLRGENLLFDIEEDTGNTVLDVNIFVALKERTPSRSAICIYI